MELGRLLGALPAVMSLSKPTRVLVLAQLGHIFQFAADCIHSVLVFGWDCNLLIRPGGL